MLQWDPQVIFVQDRYPEVVKQIQNDPQWQSIDAVKNHRVWLMPEYAKAWGYPMPEAMAPSIRAVRSCSKAVNSTP